MKIVANENGALASLYGRIISTPLQQCATSCALLQVPHPKTVSIDLSGVTHIDSSALPLIEALKIARQCKTELRLQGLNTIACIACLRHDRHSIPLQWP
jgi:ABC-type transporter Mla MlaB component